MTVGGEHPTRDGEPYTWDKSVPLPQDVVRLFEEVARGIDRSQTVVWKNAVSSLDVTNRYLHSHEEARQFMERYMRPVINILVEQQPAKIGLHERNCVEESLELAIVIIARDIRIQLKRNGECTVLDVLALIFNKKKAYYKGNNGTWLSGLPHMQKRSRVELRMYIVERFRTERGFASLAEDLSKRVSTSQFPALEVVQPILSAISDAVPVSLPECKIGADEMEDNAILIAQATVSFISNCSDDDLEKVPHEIFNSIRDELQKVFDGLIATRRRDTYEFYQSWRALTLRLITSQSLSLRMFGWDQANDLINCSVRHRPPPRRFTVSGAGCSFINGVYSFAGAAMDGGYAIFGTDVSYERKVPDTDSHGGGKILTLFRCTMRLQQKWWFLSEADEEQPGTDRDIDYYQHKSKEHEEREPPPDTWLTCSAGVDPTPKLKGEGLIVPPGEEYNTLEHHLAKWAIENEIVELVLGDSPHPEIVARSKPMIKFLSSMCKRDVPVEGCEGKMKPNMYCLKDSHLVLMWKTCMRNADPSVSTKLGQLLVSILRSLPNEMAITFLTHVQSSLRGGLVSRDCLSKVAEFPTLEVFQQMLSALFDAVPVPLPECKTGADEMVDNTILTAQAAISFISNCPDDYLKKVPYKIFNRIREDLQEFFDRLVTTRRKETYEFYQSWRALALRLIRSQSLSLRHVGWNQVNDLIVCSIRHRPPARRFTVSGAGCSFVNGVYSFAGSAMDDEYAMVGAEVSYERNVPATEKDGGGKKLTLFLCRLRSHQKWWFLSEADEEQPGTDRDIDYYQHKSKEHEEREPPPDTWLTCSAGVDPPPKLKGEGLIVPPGEEYNTLEHHLAKWAIENEIVELVLGDSPHPEIVARLVKFLSSMCKRDVPVEGFEGEMKPNMYCLKDSHLVLMWKACTIDADPSVSLELRQLLVSILRSLPNEMAITFLTHVQSSLRGRSERRDCLPEVADLCAALIVSAPVDAKTGLSLGLQSISVRREFLHLMLDVLNHPDAKALASYESLKRYFVSELHV